MEARGARTPRPPTHIADRAVEDGIERPRYLASPLARIMRWQSRIRAAG